MTNDQPAETFTVEEIVAANPYDPDILNDLEVFVNEQVNPSPGARLPLFVSFLAKGSVRRLGASRYPCPVVTTEQRGNRFVGGVLICAARKQVVAICVC
jgi:hypothetical protein